MATQALTVAETVIADGCTYVSSAQTFETRAFLASDMDAEDVVLFEATSTGPISVFDSEGARVGFVPAETAAVAKLNAAGFWQFQRLIALPATTIVDVAASAGVPTKAEWDAMAAKFNLILAQLEKLGAFKAE